MKSIKSIYLAGKIAVNDWRTSIVDRSAFNEWSNEVYPDGGLQSGRPWHVCENAIFDKYDYVGPFFVNCGHGCFYGDDDHGVGASDGGEYGPPQHGDKIQDTRQETITRCCQALSKADLVFAWIDSADCYGTIAEIGYAKALQKPVWIAGKKRFRDLWFVYEMADQVNCYDYRDSPEWCLKNMLARWETENPPLTSPIEIAFWKEWMSLTDNRYPYQLTPQLSIGKYRVDFAHVKTNTAIELDGHATHSSPDAIAYDRKRQREIESIGWKVIRFGGKEVYSNACECASEVHRLLSLHMKYNNKPLSIAEPLPDWSE